jgi:hypothetical protein
MLINDKALAAAMKKCKSGVKVRYDCGAMDILGSDWFAHIDVSRLEDKPRFTLAALVEMLGYIPEGECLEIVKGKKRYEVQDVMFDAVTGEAAGYLTAEDFTSVEKIPLTYGGTLLFQTKGLRVAGVKGGLLETLISASDARYSEELSPLSAETVKHLRLPGLAWIQPQLEGAGIHPVEPEGSESYREIATGRWKWRTAMSEYLDRALEKIDTGLKPAASIDMPIS